VGTVNDLMLVDCEVPLDELQNVTWSVTLPGDGDRGSRGAHLLDRTVNGQYALGRVDYFLHLLGVRRGHEPSGPKGYLDKWKVGVELNANGCSGDGQLKSGEGKAC